MLVSIALNPYAIYYTDCPHYGQTYIKWWTLMTKPARNTPNIANITTVTDNSVQNQSGENSLPTTVISSEHTKTCASCKQSKPKKEFLKRLTLAQTKAFLKQPNATTRYTTTSKNCKACQQLLKRKNKRPLTAKEIRSKISSGDMNSVMGEMKLEKIRQAIPKTRSRVMKEHWENIKKTLPYKQLKRHLQDQLNRYGNRHFASTHLQDATREQNSWNYIEAKRIKKDLLEQAQAGREISPDIQIASLIKSKPQ